jgi:hypothetical protein
LHFLDLRVLLAQKRHSNKGSPVLGRMESSGFRLVGDL